MGGSRRGWSVAGRGVLLCVLLLGLWARPGSAQQLVTDDADVAEFGACQVEGWVGEREAWVEPACHLIPGLEVTVGLGYERDEGGREWLLEAKYRLWAPERGPRVSLLVGRGANVPRDLIGAPDAALWFALVPVTLAVAGDRLMLHGNVGWERERDVENDDGRRDTAVWGLRGDLLLPATAERLTLLGEVFGEPRDPVEFQVGVRAVLAPERLAADLTFGGAFQRGERGAGWTLGLAWTPPGFF